MNMFISSSCNRLMFSLTLRGINVAIEKLHFLKMPIYSIGGYRIATRNYDKWLLLRLLNLSTYETDKGQIVLTIRINYNNDFNLCQMKI